MRSALLRLIWFSSSATPQKMMLSGNEELAFKDLTGGHVAVVLTKAFLSNFRESWDVLQSVLPQADQDTAP